MGLRDWIQKRNQQSQPADALQVLHIERDELRRNCQQLEGRYEAAVTEASMERQLRKEARRQAECLFVLFRTFCTQPLTAEQLYDCAAPRLDPDGFRLYAAACHVTGINIHDAFHYEENRGMFENMGFADRTRYLEAAYFGALRWEIVPGTTYERAVLGKVDAAAPEYKAYREKICTNALARMGLQDLLKTPEKARKEVEYER